MEDAQVKREYLSPSMGFQFDGLVQTNTNTVTLEMYS